MADGTITISGTFNADSADTLYFYNGTETAANYLGSTVAVHNGVGSDAHGTFQSYYFSNTVQLPATATSITVAIVTTNTFDSSFNSYSGQVNTVSVSATNAAGNTLTTSVATPSSNTSGNGPNPNSSPYAEYDVNAAVAPVVTAGATGATGTNGAVGATGATGTNGTNGAVGATGATGTNGINGTAGATGATGTNGTNGAVGATGATGTNGVNGTAGATGATGTNGINGTAGATGATGTNGIDGTAGATGATGTNGTDGAVGATGATGTDGTNGAVGATGATGTNGTNGAVGATGPMGATGPAGMVGPRGGPGIPAEVDLGSLTTTQNEDGSTSYTLSGGTFFDNKSYSSFTDSYAADGTPLSVTRNNDDGSHGVDVLTGYQAVASDFFDKFNNNGNPDVTFVFDPGHGLDVVNGFRVDGTDHDTVSLLGADFGNSIAEVLRDAHATRQGLLIVDPTTHDTVRLTGVTKTQLADHKQDIMFHA